MILSDKIIFAHMPKCAGQSITISLTETGLRYQKLRSHTPVSALPVEHHAKPCFSVIRDPWSWYVSWFFYNRTSASVNPLYVAISDNGRLNFNDSINNLLKLKDTPELIERAIALNNAFAINYVSRGWSPTLINRFIDSDIGLMSFIFNEIHDKAENKTVAPLSDVENQLNQFLHEHAQCGPVVLDEINIVNHEPSKTYYSKKLKNNIYKYESALLNVPAFVDECERY